ncbi:MAG: GspMb/PilO family protein [Gemmatimonadaceae bacterium]
MTPLILSPRDRRVLWIGFTGMASILLAGKAWPAMRKWELAKVALAAETASQLGLAERSVSLVAYAKDSAAARTKKLDAMRSKLIRGATAYSAAAALGALVETLARASHADVLTMTLRPDSVAHNGFVRVAVRLGAESDVSGMLAFLLALETHERPMIVRELSVGQADPGATPTRPEALRFDVTVETLAGVGAQASSSSKREKR